MHRFFIPPDWISNDQVIFQNEIARQMKQVLRLNPGDSVIVLDNSNAEMDVEITHIGESIEGKIISRRVNDSESKVPVTVVFTLSHREKVEWILQKCTEIGVSHFIPIITSRSLVHDATMVEQKRDRWEAIIREAAEQSGRSRLPGLGSGEKFAGVIQRGESFDLALMAWEEERTHTLSSIAGQKRFTNTALLIGPEGGFSSEEAAMAKQAHWIPFSLGKRILRMETAALVASALLISKLEG
jgi:16S rRNA (uracil1498-N3)-methyltransferase